jgi:molybdate transport repressor ModE-like protein
MATRLTIRLDFELGRRLGAGKIALLESIEKTGSISAAGRAHQMSYRRAWLLVDELNQLFAEPVVSAHHGGARGGGAALTDRAGGSSLFTAARKQRCGRRRKVKSRPSSATSAPSRSQINERGSLSQYRHVIRITARRLVDRYGLVDRRSLRFPRPPARTLRDSFSNLGEDWAWTNPAGLTFNPSCDNKSKMSLQKERMNIA